MAIRLKMILILQKFIIEQIIYLAMCYTKTIGDIIVAKKLENLPKEWDVKHNEKWNGYIPDCYHNFDKDGLDKNKKVNYTGWVAFAYMPFLGTFWPTNASTDDVLIRLSKKFRIINFKERK